MMLLLHRCPDGKMILLPGVYRRDAIAADYVMSSALTGLWDVGHFLLYSEEFFR